MAIEKEIEIRDLGVSADYHRVLSVGAVNYTPDPNVAGSIGTLAVRIASYASKDARLAGAAPLGIADAFFRFGAGVDSDGGTVAVIASDEPATRPLIYAALQQIPAFAGATAA